MPNVASARAALAPHLPHLRRHARALTGSQTSGDAWVRATLEALLDAPDLFEDGNPPKLELFRLFHAFWRPHAHQGAPARDALTLGEASLAAIPLPQREALLLTTLEDFDIAEAAIVLGRPATVVAADAEAARAAILSAMKSRVLVIEDEPLIAMHLESLVTDMGHEVVGLAATHAEAVAMAAETAPDLVLADVQLADGSSGIEAVGEILQAITVPVIFITAYPERLLTGERPEPTWLVTKPFEPATVIATMGQALLLRQPAPQPA